MPVTASSPFDTEFGSVTINLHKFLNSKETCLSIVVGNISESIPLLRLHSSCLFGESFLGTDCDCRLQLLQAIDLIIKNGTGIIIYLFQEGRGHGLEMKLRLLNTQKEFGVDTVAACEHFKLDLDPRDYSTAIQALQDLNVYRKVRLITNNPLKKQALEVAGFEITELIALSYPINDQIRDYLRVKKEKLGHIINYI